MFTYKQSLSLIDYVPNYILIRIVKKIGLKYESNLDLQELIKNSHYQGLNKIQIQKENKENIVRKEMTKYFEKYNDYLVKEIEYLKSKNKLTEVNKVDFFFDKKEELISLLHRDALDKKTFLIATFYLVKHLDLKVIEKPETIRDGLYNYQYYNALLKYRIHKGKKQDFYSETSDIEVQELYKKKDECILFLLKLCEGEKITSYYINVNSSKLFMSLYEIYVPKYNMILHSINNEIRKSLFDKGQFKIDILTSLTDKYVNTKY